MLERFGGFLLLLACAFVFLVVQAISRLIWPKERADTIAFWLWPWHAGSRW